MKYITSSVPNWLYHLLFSTVSRFRIGNCRNVSIILRLASVSPKTGCQHWLSATRDDRQYELEAHTYARQSLDISYGYSAMHSLKRYTTALNTSRMDMDGNAIAIDKARCHDSKRHQYSPLEQPTKHAPSCWLRQHKWPFSAQGSGFSDWIEGSSGLCC